MKNSFSDNKLNYTVSTVLSLKFLFILCISCGSLPKNSLPADAYSHPVSWFESDTGHFLFTTSIDVMNNHLSGITVVKPSGAGKYRVIIITETGLKILDMEFFPDSLPRVHYIMEQMDRKILIRVLQKDMHLMLMNHVYNLSPAWYKNFIISPSITAMYKVNGEKYFYILEPGRTKPSVALLGKGRKFNVEVSFFGKPDSGIDSIKLSHNNLNLSTRLYRIHE